jgi:PQQ-dependent dehydrogenase (methanol/ethanol family)
MRMAWSHSSGWVRLGCIGALIALPGLGAAAQGQGQGLFDNNPVGFTAPQAARGQSAYEDDCASCHGGHLDDGQFGPPLKGPAFRAQWHSQSAAAFFSLVATTMPPASPDSLDSQTYADIDAYLLQQNGARAGTGARSIAEIAKNAPPARPRAYGADFLGNRDATYQAAMAHRQAILDTLTPVTAPMLRNPPAGDWLMWRGTYGATGYSRLEQITARNAGDLAVAWTLSLPASGNEITPLVHDGVLFVESANTVEALNGTDGSVLWRYVRQLPARLHDGRQARIKALAIYQDKLYAPTADGHLVALDVRTGRLIWDTAIGSSAQGTHQGRLDRSPYELSGGPIVADGKVIVGVSLALNAAGGDFIVGLDAQTGKELWRFHTIARPGQPGGDSWNGAPVDQRYGGGVWTVGSFDPDLNLVYFGTGNTYDTGTLLLPRAHPGGSNDALYTDSTLALDPDTGKLVWYYQHMKRDVWDMDWVFEQSLLTLPVNGRPRKLLVTGGKLAIFDALDRTNGKYEFSTQSGLQNLVVRIDPRTGAKTVNPALETPRFGQSYYICPSTLGERNWIATSFDPTTDILYVPLLDACMDFHLVPRDAAQVAAGGDDISRSPIPPHGSDGQFGRIEAINLRTRKTVWTLRQRAPLESSMLATAGGVIFSGSHDRRFHAYASATGKLLWQTTLNSAPSASPITYDAGGEQYVAVVAGGGSPLDAVASALTPEIADPSGSTTLWVFRLRDARASGN